MKTRLKFFLFIMVVPIALLMSLAVLLRFSNIISFFQAGADPASIFRGHELIVPAVDEAVLLVSNLNRGGKYPTRSQRDELITSYWLAWEAVARAYETGLTADLATSWGLPALEILKQSISDGGFRTEQHQVRLIYFSEDGTFASVEDKFVVYTDHYMLNVKGDAILTLDDGRWRVRYLELHYNDLVTMDASVATKLGKR